MKKTLSLLIALLILLAAAGCHDDMPLGVIVVETNKAANATEKPDDPAATGTNGNNGNVNINASYPAYTKKDGTWAIYMYICGADLESGSGLASMDIGEVLKAKLPDNVKVVMEMGGAKKWKLELDQSALNRMSYGSQGSTILDSVPLASMGDPNTLADYLTFCNTNYPAEHQVVVMWDHGGGSLYGYGYDELYKGDALTLAELDAAFKAAPAASGKYEIIGFDACLMATIDVVSVVKNHANYLVASEELETGLGWYYTGALEALVADTTQPASQFAQAICDTFYGELVRLNELSDKLNMYQESTLSVVDLSKADILLAAYKDMADESLLLAVDGREEYLSEFARAAKASENYGINTKEGGYYDMVDIGDLADNAAKLLPTTAAKVKDALADCVVYQVKGPLRSKASGVSCYYCYSGKQRSVKHYKEAGASKSAMYYHEYGTTGKLTTEGIQYVEYLGAELGKSKSTVYTLADTAELGLDDFPVQLDKNGEYWEINIGPERVKSVSAVYTCILFEFAEDMGGENVQVLYGASTQMTYDWKNGVFSERFDGMWGSINGMIVFMRAIATGEGYVTYIAPVMVNDVPHIMYVSQGRDGKYTILGIREKILNEEITEMAPKDLKQLQHGDVLKPIYYFMMTQENGEKYWDIYTIGSTTITDAPTFQERGLGDGRYKVMFHMVDYAGKDYFSQYGNIKVKGNSVERVGDMVTYQQPENTIKGGMLIKSYLAVNPNADIPYYIGTVDANIRAEAEKSFGFANPGKGNQTWVDPVWGPGSYEIELYTSDPNINLEKFLGERNYYMTGNFVDGRAWRHRDLAFEITGIMSGNGEENKPAVAGYIPGYSDGYAPVYGDDTNHGTEREIPRADIIKTLSGGTYSLTVVNDSSDSNITSDVQVYVKGGDSAVTLVSGLFEGRMVYKNGEIYMMLDSIRQYAPMGTGNNPAESFVPNVSGYIFVESGTEIFKGKRMEYDEYKLADGILLRLYIDGGKLAGMRVTSSESSEFAVSNFKSSVPSEIFDIQNNYTLYEIE